MRLLIALMMVLVAGNINAADLRNMGMPIAEAAENAPIRVGFYNYPPMMIKQSGAGIYHDIFKAIERITNLRFKIEYLPYARSKHMFDRNEIDIDPGISPTWTKDLPVPGVFTISFAQSVDVILFGSGKRFRVKHPGDLTGKMLGTVRGYFYPGFMEYFADNTVSRFEGVDEIQLLTMLAHSHLDQIIVNRAIALYWISQNPTFPQLELGDEVGTVDIMMRVHPDKAHLIPELNAAIKQMKQSGEIERFYLAYQ